MDNKRDFTLSIDNKSIKINVIDGDMWVAPKDVSYMLNVSITETMLTKLNDTEKRIIGETTMINSTGLLSLIISSDDKFSQYVKKWAIDNVLPLICNQHKNNRS